MLNSNKFKRFFSSALNNRDNINKDNNIAINLFPEYTIKDDITDTLQCLYMQPNYVWIPTLDLMRKNITSVDLTNTLKDIDKRALSEFIYIKDTNLLGLTSYMINVSYEGSMIFGFLYVITQNTLIRIKTTNENFNLDYLGAFYKSIEDVSIITTISFSKDSAIKKLLYGNLNTEKYTLHIKKEYLQMFEETGIVNVNNLYASLKDGSLELDLFDEFPSFLEKVEQEELETV